MPAEQACPAIVLRARDYSEADRIVTCLTPDLGKLAGIAKGAKLSRRRFERKLEPFAHVMLYFRRRPHGQLVFLTRAEASADLPPFNLDDDLGKIALGLYMLELADALTAENAEAAGAYRLLEAALESLSAGGASASIRQAFELRMLQWAGFGLDFSRCRWCHGPAATGEAAGAFFVATRGGVACARCGPGIEQATIRLEPASLAALVELGEMEFSRALGAPAAGADGALAIARFVASVLDRRLRSTAFLDSILQNAAR